MAKKSPPRMNPRAYDVFVRAVEEGAQMAVTQMFKYLSTLTEADRDHMVVCIEREVGNEVCEVFTFRGEEDPEGV